MNSAEYDNLIRVRLFILSTPRADTWFKVASVETLTIHAALLQTGLYARPYLWQIPQEGVEFFLGFTESPNARTTRSQCIP